MPSFSLVKKENGSESKTEFTPSWSLILLSGAAVTLFLAKDKIIDKILGKNENDFEDY